MSLMLSELLRGERQLAQINVATVTSAIITISVLLTYRNVLISLALSHSKNTKKINSPLFQIRQFREGLERTGEPRSHRCRGGKKVNRKNPLLRRTFVSYLKRTNKWDGVFESVESFIDVYFESMSFQSSINSFQLAVTAGLQRGHEVIWA